MCARTQLTNISFGVAYQDVLVAEPERFDGPHPFSLSGDTGSAPVVSIQPVGKSMFSRDLVVEAMQAYCDSLKDSANPSPSPTLAVPPPPKQPPKLVKMSSSVMVLVAEYQRSLEEFVAQAGSVFGPSSDIVLMGKHRLAQFYLRSDQVRAIAPCCARCHSVCIVKAGCGGLGCVCAVICVDTV